MLDEPQLTGANPVGPGDLVADRYELESELGRGGYAIVYRALDRETGERVAVKTIRPVAPRPQEVVARFRQEAQLVSRLTHPNTVRVFDFGFHPELYLAMELLQGCALSDILDGVNGLEPHRAVAIARGVLESLSEAHEQGIVHRDLKPENVFLVQHEDGTETVKVLDFGIAKVLGFSEEEMNQPSLTLQGRAMGTPTYMSPEQARGAALTTRSDIYAVAVLLYEMLCGVPPFQGKGPMDVMLQHVNADVPALTVPALRGTLIDRAVQKALAKKPEDRFANAWEFLAALGGIALRAPGIAPVAQPLPPQAAQDPGPSRRVAGARSSGRPAAVSPTHSRASSRSAPENDDSPTAEPCSDPEEATESIRVARVDRAPGEPEAESPGSDGALPEAAIDPAPNTPTTPATSETDPTPAPIKETGPIAAKPAPHTAHFEPAAESSSGIRSLLFVLIALAGATLISVLWFATRS
ncbi:MAG: serine/threonine protein kinase [Deltaproteobacteria bacterium]|nr:MAG: serine/threonine protein kinase [Deltaproteobacteria bacterium]